MKVRKKDLCHTCRRRKLQCDGKLPACSQCRISKRKCGGYPEALFVPFVSATTRPKRCGRETPMTSSSQPRPTRVPSSEDSPGVDRSMNEAVSSPNTTGACHSSKTGNPISLDDQIKIHEMVSLIIRNYVPLEEAASDVANSYLCPSQICGSWVTALPKLITNAADQFTECLYSAISTLALSIVAYQSQEGSIQVASAQYEISIRHLVHNLAVVRDTYRNELLAAAMCLALSEALLPISPMSWLVHVEGVGNMIQSSPPESFASGIEHTLFIGFRPLLILKAFILRKATFFANDEWVEKPFKHYRPAPLQDLLGLAARIPGILEDIHDSVHDSSETAVEAARQRFAKLLDIRSRLEGWYKNFSKSAPMPLYWHRTPENANHGDLELLWYQDLSTANALTYLWSFQIICLTHINSLSERFPYIASSTHMTTGGVRRLRDACIESSVRIYQSMEYVMQEAFMLYGISSAHFPVRTARRALEMDAKGRAILGTLDPTIVIRSRA